MRTSPPRRFRSLVAAVALLLAAGGEQDAQAAVQPWMNTAQTPEQRAAELLAAMTPPRS